MKTKGLLFSSAALLLSTNITHAAIQVDTFSSAGTVNSLAIADNLISGAAANNGTGSATPNFVDHYDGSGGTGNFTNNLAFPGGFTTDFALHATCNLNIPVAGDYTFGTNNDDGTRLRIDGGDVIVDDSLHGTQNFFGTVNLSAGLHTLDLVFFERGGGASVELFAAPGNFAGFDASMRLVGDTANGGLACNDVLGTTGTIAMTGIKSGSDLIITVTDPDLNTNLAAPDSIVVTVVNDDTGESEDVTLTETGPNTGIFEGPLPTAHIDTTGTDNDGVLNTQVTHTITATYDDALDDIGADPAAVTANTTISDILVIPTLSTWGLIFMSSLLGLFGIFGNRRKRLK